MVLIPQETDSFSLTVLHHQLSFIHGSHVSYVFLIFFHFSISWGTENNTSCYGTAKQNNHLFLSISQELVLVTNHCRHAGQRTWGLWVQLRLFKGKLAVCVNKKCVNLTKLTEKPLQLMLFQLHDYIQLKQFDILFTEVKSLSRTGIDLAEGRRPSPASFRDNLVRCRVSARFDARRLQLVLESFLLWPIYLTNSIQWKHHISG